MEDAWCLKVNIASNIRRMLQSYATFRTRHGVYKLCSKGMQPLLGARSPTANVKITLSGMPNLLNYCAVFTVGYIYNLQKNTTRGA